MDKTPTYRDKTFGRSIVDIQDEALLAEQRQVRQYLYNLVHGDGGANWNAARGIIESIVARFAAPPPKTPDGIVAYQTFNTMKDIVTAVVSEIESYAQQGAKLLEAEKHGEQPDLEEN